MKLGTLEFLHLGNVAIYFASDVINKWVKHILLEVCLCRINFSICAMLLANRGG